MFKYLLLISVTLLTVMSCSACFLSRSVKDLLTEVDDSIVAVDTGFGTCTGFHIGYDTIVTAGHCVERNHVNAIYDSHGHEYKATVIKDNDVKDLAIIKVENFDGGHLVLGNEPRIGERLLSIGYPWYAGGAKSFEVGYLKAIIEVPERRLLIADDVSFRGESGGPCLDERGFLVGVIVAVAPLQDRFDNTGLHQHKNLSIIVSVDDLLVDLRKSSIGLPW